MNLPAGSGQKRSPGWIVFWFVAGTLLGIWPALTNGSPFFYYDTTAYVRGADFAISKVLGSRFATDWAKDQRRTIQPQSSMASAGPPAVGPKAGRRVVLAGRSVIYGLLLYFGELSGGMWLSVIVQSSIAVYLVYVFVVRTLGLEFRYFLISYGVLLVASPLPFCASFLMPDVFAGFLVLTFAILATSWERLGILDRAIPCMVLLFAVLSHITHVGLLLALTILTAAYVLCADHSRWTQFRRLIPIVVACLALAALWEVAFSIGVRRAFGMAPVRPPFLTAKLVSTLGAPAVAKVCESSSFAVCRFQDRFPTDVLSFLWSEDERKGVFAAADVQTKQLLHAEEVRFARAIIPPNRGLLVLGLFRDTLRQLTDINLAEYSREQWQSQSAFLGETVPSHEFEKLTSTLSARSDWYAVFGRRVLSVTTVMAAIINLLFLGGIFVPHGLSSSDLEQGRAWRAATSIVFAGIIVNAAICGSLSIPLDRFGARVIWLIQLAAVTGVCASLARLRVRRSAETRAGGNADYYDGILDHPNPEDLSRARQAS
jgi:hypothetical protein